MTKTKTVLVDTLSMLMQCVQDKRVTILMRVCLPPSPHWLPFPILSLLPVCLHPSCIAFCLSSSIHPNLGLFIACCITF